MSTAGALVRYKGAFHRVADPLRHLVDGLQSLTNPVGSPLDKVNVGVFRTRTLLSSFQSILAKEETTTLTRLRVRPPSPSLPPRAIEGSTGRTCRMSTAS